MLNFHAKLTTSKCQRTRRRATRNNSSRNERRARRSHSGVRGAGRVSVRLVQPEPVVRDGRRADVPVAREFRRRLHDVAEQFVRGLRVRGAIPFPPFR